MDRPEHLLVLTTLPIGADATAFATTLVGERLAACVTIHEGAQSVYRWKGAIERDAERLVFIKTTSARWEALHARVRELHPYEVPELIAVPLVAGSPPYLAWLAEATQADAEPGSRLI
jgi:periplasmic divalent cation tolerance protein